MDAKLAKLARQLNLRNGIQTRIKPIPPIILMTDSQRLPDPVPTISRLPRGSMVIFRHYDHPNRHRIALATRRACRRYGHLFIIANDPHLARRLGADGDHFPEYHLWQDRAHLRTAKGNAIRTIACHSRQALAKIIALPCSARPDAVLISPVFASLSHPYAPCLGIATFSEMAALARWHYLHAVALGGINRNTALSLRPTKACGFAGIGFGL
ncbi:thiamine phosphate synthase [Thalassospira sp.]|uniref:thiamine phosphate synthase n=1 Tax=Thalassospira sp. TaxID=1912094 RepID=UPI0027364129|nr:thiamine phosphate synthase [Thalassospira sp.]MDP2699228.1 thiamine phosphate synthase [Thalassospira sp.]